MKELGNLGARSGARPFWWGEAPEWPDGVREDIDLSMALPRTRPTRTPSRAQR